MDENAYLYERVYSYDHVCRSQWSGVTTTTLVVWSEVTWSRTSTLLAMTSAAWNLATVTSYESGQATSTASDVRQCPLRLELRLPVSRPSAGTLVPAGYSGSKRVIFTRDSCTGRYC